MEFLSRLRFSFRTKLSAQFFGLTLLTIGGLTYFFLTVYSREKLATAYEKVLSDAIQAAQYLENTLLYAKQSSSEQIRTSPSIVFAIDDPCEGTPSEIISGQYMGIFERMLVAPRSWLKSLTDQNACELLKKSGLVFLAEEKELQFPLPTVLALVQKASGGQRLVMISMEFFSEMDAEGDLGLVDQAGRPVWPLLRKSPLETAPPVKLINAQLGPRTEQTLAQGLPSVAPLGKGAIAAVAPVLSKWALVALSNESRVLGPVRFLVTQSLWLTAGFFFLCMLAGKIIADNVSRPLRALSGAAQEFGKGKLSARLEVTQTDEFGLLEETFNSMAGKIENLLGETRTRALLEADVQLAQKVQEMLFPPNNIQLPEHEISSFVKMASRCGGDWWGCINVPDPGKSPLLLVLIGDVTGHGVSSALLTAAAQGGASVLASWVTEQPALAKDPRFLLKLFNRAIYDSARGTVQMSFFTAVIDVNTDTIYASNAAHNWPYLITPKEGDARAVSVTPIGNSSPVLGQERDTPFSEVVTAPWKKNSQLFLYTDGLIDAYQDDVNRFDRRALVKVLRQSGGLKGAAVLKKVLDARTAAAGTITQEDDITAVVCVRKGNA